MNKKQLTVLWIGIIIIVLMGLFPPWHVEISGAQQKFSFSFILFPPQINTHTVARPVINTTQLLIQWCIIGFMTFGYIVTYHDKT